MRVINPDAEGMSDGTAARPQRPRRVVLVDDEVTLRDLLAEFLQDEGYEVLTAGNGRQALAILRDQPTDAIVLDLGMPVMDGAAFRQQQLLQPHLAAIPVIVLSADRELDRHCLALR